MGAYGNTFNASGRNFRLASNLTELFLDDTKFQDVDRRHDYMFQHCSSLQRLSIKNATNDIYFTRAEPMPQERIVKMVRLHPTLRWLRSDLTEENVAMLQQERPEITLVSE